MYTFPWMTILMLVWLRGRPPPGLFLATLLLLWILIWTMSKWKVIYKLYIYTLILNTHQSPSKLFVKLVNASDMHLTYIIDNDVNSTESCVNEDILARSMVVHCYRCDWIVINCVWNTLRAEVLVWLHGTSLIPKLKTGL